MQYPGQLYKLQFLFFNDWDDCNELNSKENQKLILVISLHRKYNLYYYAALKSFEVGSFSK